MTPLVCVEKHRYPDLADAIAAVRDVWKDRPLAVEAESAHEWRLRVGSGWPMTPFPDPNAERVARAAFGVDAAGAHAYRRMERWGAGPLFLVCLNHCWALWAWSQAVARATDDTLTIVHLDAHADLQVPPLVCTDARGCFAAPTGGSRVDLGDPGSVESAILQGFVGIGGFIVPLMHANPDCDLVHVGPSHPAPRGAHVSYLGPRDLPCRTLTGMRKRPAMVAHARARQVYLWTDVAEDLVRLEPRGGVLLDVDMDYFCNRFEAPSQDRSRHEVAAEIDRVAVCLRAASWRHRVIAITVALSPGFFPSEYWVDALACLEAALRSIYEPPGALLRGR
ncbi:MAG TPA: UPF0489 family protein [Longimicrobium sp.]|jgi:hypothetical protein